MRKRHVGTRSLVIAALAVAASLVGAVSASAQAPSTPFTQCPAVGDNTSCRILIVVTNSGTQAFVDNAQAATYDGDDDTLIGVLNQRTGQSATLNSLDLSSPTLPIFGFDNDGICTQNPGPDCTGFPDPNGYGGPGVTFSNISPDFHSGTVNFAGGLGTGVSAYFGLEDEVGVSDLFGLETHVSRHFTAVGGPGVSDTAVIVDDDPNDNSRPTGLITWHVYGPDDPTCSGDPVDTFVHGVDGGGAYTSGEFHPTVAGFYTFVAEFASDSQAFPSTVSGCFDAEEHFAVGPKLTTNAQVTATVGQTIHDVATLSGANNPVGRITFELYGPDDPNCNHVPVFVVDAPVQTGNGDYSSQQFTTQAAGTYRWIARWEGDERNPTVQTSCNDPNETSVVNPTPQIVVVPAHATGHARFKVKYARVVRPFGKRSYLLVRVSSRRTQHVRLRIRLSARGWSGQTVTRRVWTNRAVKIRGLHLYGTKKVKVTILGR
jgi:hypothetical protein